MRWWFLCVGAGCVTTVNVNPPAGGGGGGGGSTSSGPSTPAPTTTGAGDALPCGDGCEWSRSVLGPLTDRSGFLYSAWDAAIGPDGTEHVLVFDPQDNEIRYLSSVGDDTLVAEPALGGAYSNPEISVGIAVGADGFVHTAFVVVELGEYGQADKEPICTYAQLDGSGLVSTSTLGEMRWYERVAIQLDAADHPMVLCGSEGLHRWDGSSWDHLAGDLPAAEATTTDERGRFVAASAGELWTADAHAWSSEAWLPDLRINVHTVEVLPDGSTHVGGVEVLGSDVAHVTDESGSWRVDVLDDFGVPTHAELAQDSLGRLHVAWVSEAEGGLVYGVRDGDTWSLEPTGLAVPYNRNVRLRLDPMGDAPRVYAEDIDNHQLVVFRGR